MLHSRFSQIFFFVFLLQTFSVGNPNSGIVFFPPSQMPEDLAHLDPDTQQFHVKIRAAYLMAVGTALVLIFSGT